jgi:RNA polymerase sigma factor (sigma-70 family)
VRGLHAEAASPDLRRAYEKHWRPLVRLCALLVSDLGTAEDIVQEVFIRARERLHGLSDEQAYAYLRRGTLNGWKNWLRSQGRIRHAVPLHEADQLVEAPGPEERDLLWRQVVALPERQRAVVILRYYEELSDGEIARVLGCRQVTVRSQAKRALDKLREAIQG